jgi:hypothetical protein
VHVAGCDVCIAKAAIMVPKRPDPPLFLYLRTGTIWSAKMLAENMMQARLISENDVNDVLRSIHAESMVFINNRKKKSNPEGLLSIEEFSHILRRQFRWHLTGCLHKIV